MSNAAIIKSQMNFIAEARRVLAYLQDPVWAASEAKPDEDHVTDYASTIAKTREHFPKLPKNTEMQMVLGDGDVVFALTGNSPDAAERARAIVGFLRSMPYLLDDLEQRIKSELESI